MFLARVTGSVVATQKVASMTGRKLLTVEPLRVDPGSRDRLVSTGRSTATGVETGDCWQMDAPAGWQIGGFIGRSGDEVDQLATLFIKPIFSQGTPFMHRTDPVPNLSSWSTPPPRSKLRHTPDL